LFPSLSLYVTLIWNNLHHISENIIITIIINLPHIRHKKSQNGPKQRCHLQKTPGGLPQAASHLVIETREFDLTQLLLRWSDHQEPVRQLRSYMRGRMRDPVTTTSYSAAFELDKPITAYSLGQVIASENERFQKGDIIWTGLPVEEYSAVPKEELTTRARKLEMRPDCRFRTTWVFRHDGLTAYSSCTRLEAQEGRDHFIFLLLVQSGQIVGQMRS